MQDIWPTGWETLVLSVHMVIEDSREVSTDVLKILEVECWEPHNLSSAVVGEIPRGKGAHPTIYWGSGWCHIAHQSAHRWEESGVQSEKCRWADSSSRIRDSGSQFWRGNGSTNLHLLPYGVTRLGCFSDDFQQLSTTITNGWYLCWGWLVL